MADEGRVPAATTSRRSRSWAARGRGGQARVGGDDAHLVDQVGQLAHRPHEVPGGHLAGVPGGHLERGAERRPPGPGGHGGRQARLGLGGPGHHVDLLQGPDPLEVVREAPEPLGQLGPAPLPQPVARPPWRRAGRGVASGAPPPGPRRRPAGPGASRTRPPRAPRPRWTGSASARTSPEQGLGDQQVGLVVHGRASRRPASVSAQPST